MTQFLNNLWTALNSANIELLNFLLIPLGIIENYLVMNLFLTIFDVKAYKKQKNLYVSLILIISLLSSNLIPAPFNIILNYTCTIFLIKFFFKLNLLKSFISLIVPTFIFVLLNILLQNPYLRILNVSPEDFIVTPIYRFTYLIILYTIFLAITALIKKSMHMKFTLDILDILDNKTKKILGFNILTGFITLGIQLIITAFYIEIVPVIITTLNFILLILFFVLSIYTFTRMIKLANARRDLECAEEYNKSLEIMYDEVKGFKHDFNNIVSTLDGFIENNDLIGLKNYFNDVKKDCKITNNLSIINPRTINNPGIYSLLNNKYFKATNLGINFEVEYFLNLNDLEVNLYQLSRILGVLIDNAIEEAEKCENKLVKLNFIRESRNNRAIISIQNTYSNKDVDIETIFNKGLSGKENHSGIGLWEVRNYIRKSKNLDLFTNKNNDFFIQELSIYDIKEK